MPLIQFLIWVSWVNCYALWVSALNSFRIFLCQLCVILIAIICQKTLSNLQHKRGFDPPLEQLKKTAELAQPGFPFRIYRIYHLHYNATSLTVQWALLLVRWALLSANLGEGQQALIGILSIFISLVFSSSSHYSSFLVSQAISVVPIFSLACSSLKVLSGVSLHLHGSHAFVTSDRRLRSVTDHALTHWLPSHAPLLQNSSQTKACYWKPSSGLIYAAFRWKTFGRPVLTQWLGVPAIWVNLAK